MAEPKELNVYQRLLAVQSEAHAPRAISGKFGMARNAEQILEAVKPVCATHGLLLITTDEAEEVGGRVRLKATATVYSVEDPSQSISTSSSAWENEVEVNKYGAPILDTSQVSGKTGSYAKKYALQHLFAIDDTKDADQDEPIEDTTPAPRGEDSPEQDPDAAELARAKKAINEELETQGYTAAVAKKAFISKVLSHSTIDNLNEADLVMDALDNERGPES